MSRSRRSAGSGVVAEDQQESLRLVLASDRSAAASHREQNDEPWLEEPSPSCAAARGADGGDDAGGEGGIESPPSTRGGRGAFGASAADGCRDLSGGEGLHRARTTGNAAASRARASGDVVGESRSARRANASSRCCTVLVPARVLSTQPFSPHASNSRRSAQPDGSPAARRAGGARRGAPSVSGAV